MDVRCERCKAQYVFDDEQVTPSGLAVQCTNCGHLFKVKKKELVVTVAVKPGEIEGEPMPASAAAPRVSGHAPADARSEPREWRVRSPGGSVRTCRELTTVQKWIVEGKIARDDEISVGGDTWKRLGDIEELETLLRGGGAGGARPRDAGRRVARIRARAAAAAVRLSTARDPAAAARDPRAAASCARPGASAGASARAAWGTRGARGRGPRGGRRDGSRVRAGGTRESEGQGARAPRGGDRRREADGSRGDRDREGPRGRSSRA